MVVYLLELIIWMLKINIKKAINDYHENYYLLVHLTILVLYRLVTKKNMILRWP